MNEALVESRSPCLQVFKQRGSSPWIFLSALTAVYLFFVIWGRLIQPFEKELQSSLFQNHSEAELDRFLVTSGFVQLPPPRTLPAGRKLRLSKLAKKALNQGPEFLELFEKAFDLFDSKDYFRANQTFEKCMGRLFRLDILKSLSMPDAYEHPTLERCAALLEPFLTMFRSRRLDGKATARKIQMLLFLMRVRCMIEIQDYYNVRYFARLLLNDFHQDRLESFLGVPISQIQYPKPFLNQVKIWSEQYGLGEHLAYAVMREESHFKRDIVSSAGACGLMQVLPSTAGILVKKLKKKGVKLAVNKVSKEDLFNESLNIRLGIFFLGELLRRFKGKKHQALAAYNAGPRKVMRWNQNDPGDAQFLKRISFPETRRYIHKVLMAEFYYDQIYSGED